MYDYVPFRDNPEAPGASVSSNRFPIQGTFPRQHGVPSKSTRGFFFCCVHLTDRRGFLFGIDVQFSFIRGVGAEERRHSLDLEDIEGKLTLYISL